MDLQLTESWLDLLMEIPQARDALRTRHGMCCLGVGYENLVRAGKREWVHNWMGEPCLTELRRNGSLDPQDAALYGLGKKKTVSRMYGDELVTEELSLQDYLVTVNDGGFGPAFMRRIIRMELGL